MIRVMKVLCPNWKFQHCNRAARRLQEKIDDLQDQVAELKRQLNAKRKRGDDYDCDDEYSDRSGKHFREY